MIAVRTIRTLKMLAFEKFVHFYAQLKMTMFMFALITKKVVIGETIGKYDRKLQNCTLQMQKTVSQYL